MFFVINMLKLGLEISMEKRALPVNPGFLGNAKTLASGKTKWRQIVDDPERCCFYDTKDKDLSSHPAPSCRRVENVRGTMVTSRLANCNLETRSLADL
ncbi:hypothetical protein U9M48_022381 [Paspalum notatum var. saurae]|uniref:Uncharacterized protein n=1 Tax=Paspalum notatum var. saurae TaxID=547442 RepID=A0AAQ3WV35_PASNO